MRPLSAAFFEYKLKSVAEQKQIYRPKQHNKNYCRYAYIKCDTKGLAIYIKEPHQIADTGQENDEPEDFFNRRRYIC